MSYGKDIKIQYDFNETDRQIMERKIKARLNKLENGVWSYHNSKDRIDANERWKSIWDIDPENT